jgi:high-affinity Fe2+/Pb2+ permease
MTKYLDQTFFSMVGGFMAIIIAGLALLVITSRLSSNSTQANSIETVRVQEGGEDDGR